MVSCLVDLSFQGRRYTTMIPITCWPGPRMVSRPRGKRSLNLFARQL